MIQAILEYKSKYKLLCEQEKVKNFHMITKSDRRDICVDVRPYRIVVQLNWFRAFHLFHFRAERNAFVHYYLYHYIYLYKITSQKNEWNAVATLKHETETLKSLVPKTSHVQFKLVVVCGTASNCKLSRELQTSRISEFMFVVRTINHVTCSPKLNRIKLNFGMVIFYACCVCALVHASKTTLYLIPTAHLPPSIYPTYLFNSSDMGWNFACCLNTMPSHHPIIRYPGKM